MNKLLSVLIAGVFAVVGTTAIAQDKKAEAPKAEAKKDAPKAEAAKEAPKAAAKGDDKKAAAEAAKKEKAEKAAAAKKEKAEKAAAAKKEKAEKAAAAKKEKADKAAAAKAAKGEKKAEAKKEDAPKLKPRSNFGFQKKPGLGPVFFRPRFCGIKKAPRKAGPILPRRRREVSTRSRGRFDCWPIGKREARHGVFCHAMPLQLVVTKLEP